MKMYQHVWIGIKNPFKFLKTIMPKGLFGRSLIILLMPLLIVQISLSYVFFERHTETILRMLSSRISGNISIIMHWKDQEFLSLEKISTLAKDNMALDVSFDPHEILDKTGQYRDSFLYTPLMAALNEKVKEPYFVRFTPDNIIIKIQKKDGVLTISLLRKLFFSRTTPLVLIWTTISALLLFTVSSLFMRNQIRPIRRLARAADLFGQGDDEVIFKPEGALEVRQAGEAFLRMRERLKRLLSERLEMLAGVSHDLRTPITRLKLAAVMLPQSLSREQIIQDINMLSEMLEDFLAYARGVTEEKLRTVSLVDWIKSICKSHNSIPISISGDPILSISIKKLAVNRCLTNLVVNSEKNAKNLWIRVEQANGVAVVLFDDDGPGIIENERENVFKPFYRLDQSRNLDSVGTGLGLSIAKDVMLSHGGIIQLEDSPYGGLRVRLIFPIHNGR